MCKNWAHPVERMRKGTKKVRYMQIFINFYAKTCVCHFFFLSLQPKFSDTNYRMNDSLIDIHRPIMVCKASAGTGKTYTLAAYFIGLLLSGEDYRSIMAITFTNKATAEMSERILTYLYALSRGEERDFLNRSRMFMIRDRQLPDEQLDARAGKCFRAMLADFDNVHVMTIDSFLQTLLGGLASVLRMSAGLSTELDIDHVIRTAVDQLLTTEMSAADRTILEDYMRLKLDQESQWDVRQSLCGMAKELYNESVQVLDSNGQILFNAAAIAQRRKAIEEKWLQDERKKELEGLLDGIHTEDLVVMGTVGPRPLPHVKDIDRACERLRNTLKSPEKTPTKDRFRGLTETQLADAKAGKWTKLPVQVVEDTVRATELAKELAHRYNTLQLTIRFSRDMELMSSLQALIQRNLAEANCALLARTAGTLSKALRAGDADFILEKAGIRYRHVLIDEFQDTSQLQWSVIRQLLQDVLANEGNTLLIVGDIKQSIYRWRNGDWHIMESLTGERVNETSLTRNFRSSEEVVKFNLSLFDHIIHSADEALVERIYSEGFSPEKLEQFYQGKKKKGGYVRFHAIPNGQKEDLAAEMFDEMEQLLQKGAKPSDMMVLVREKKDAALITDLHAALDKTQYPLLSHAAIVSADSFLLEASEAVQTVIAGLKVIARKDDVAAKYISMTTQKSDITEQIKAHNLSTRTPLYEAVSDLVKILLTDAEGQYNGSETAYINSLLDRTRDYVSAYGSDIPDFLTYWDDTLHGKSIPAASADAIRILTVHASKGLQAQTLFVPFCMWTKEAGKHPQKIWCRVAEEIGDKDFVPIQDGSEMADSAYIDEYTEEHMNMRIDNLNMLYVALTRAEDNLYISTAYPVKQDGTMGACNHVGLYIRDFVQGDEYESGERKIERPLRSESKVESEKPFSFEGAPAIQAEVWANSDQVRFVQSQEGALYTDMGDEAYRRVARMEEGTLCHEIFANIRRADELEAVLDEFESRGEIRDPQQRQELKDLISSAWKGNAQMHDWFTAPWVLELEHDVLIDRKKIRPDRVMINSKTNEAIVLDYKFGAWHGKPDPQYEEQVRRYMAALKEIGHPSVRGFLWYARKEKGDKLVEIDEK